MTIFGISSAITFTVYGCEILFGSFKDYHCVEQNFNVAVSANSEKIAQRLWDFGVMLDKTTVAVNHSHKLADAI